MNHTKDTKIVSLLIPTLNAGLLWNKVMESVSIQNYPIDRKIIVDSGSNDATVSIAKTHGFEVIQITMEQFNHGATRQLLVNQVDDTDICIFLTQDAILNSESSVENIVKVFNDPKIGLAYGRQLPHENAKPLEIHARLFNYPNESDVRSYADRERLGFKVFFCSNSFAAYKRDLLIKVGGFPSDSIMGEDALVTAKMLIKGYKIAYVADATVRHSHSYTFKEEFKRYFDTRVFHEQNKWLIEKYGKPTGEGFKYLKSEFKYISNTNPLLLLKSANSILAKCLGYTFAKTYKYLPLFLLKRVSMHKSYWK